MATLPNHDEPEAGTALGSYRLVRRLGSGGMGEVWLAAPTEKKRGVPGQIVIKRLASSLVEDERALRRFLDEARLAQVLRHPNVIALYEVGDSEGVPFMAMEYVDGLHLRQCLQASAKPMAPPFAAAILAEACAGLDYAHNLADEHGNPLKLVHRDIAPDNVMVDRRGRVKLVDFGIARTANTDLTTKAGDRRGKVRYVAPEYIRGEEATPRSDVYSMGAVLFELCTGKKPFEERRNILDIAQAILKTGLPQADLVRPGLPAEMVAIIAQAAHKDPARRFATAGDLERALRRFVKKYAAPSPAQIGREISVWKDRLEARRGAPATGSPDSPPRASDAAGPAPAPEPPAPAAATPQPTPDAPPSMPAVDEADGPPTVRTVLAEVLAEEPASPPESELPSIIISAELASDVIVIPPPAKKPRRG